MKREEGLARIAEIVADSLALDLDEIEPESRLIDDLGADSLDFVDFLFSIEKTFGIKVRDGELDFLSRLDVASPEALNGEYLKPEAVDKLVLWLPELAKREDKSTVTPSQLFSLITVETLWLMIEKRLQ